jgi:hypothetical protein
VTELSKAGTTARYHFNPEFHDEKILQTLLDEYPDNDVTMEDDISPLFDAPPHWSYRADAALFHFLKGCLE